MIELGIAIATLGRKGYELGLTSMNTFSFCTWPAIFGRSNMPLMAKHEYMRYHLPKCEIVGYVHDDVMVYQDAWDMRVLQEFVDPKVGLVGFGGAKRHGTDDLYKKPYYLPKLGRAGFISNMRDAELHGARFTGACDVAVLDGFAMFVRSSILESVGGWPVDTPINYFCYDYWLSCIVRRLGYRIRVLGIECDHLGGRTASLVRLQDSHEEAHRYIYDHFRDVLPYEVSKWSQHP